MNRIVVSLAIVAVALVVVEQTRRRGTAGARRFFRHPTHAAGLFFLLVFVLLTALAPWVAPFSPSRPLDILALQNRPPSLHHPLGTDIYSRDVLSRLVYAGRVSLGIGTLAMIVAVTIGAGVGAVAGYARGWPEAILMRIVDVGLAVPRIFLLLLTIALWEHLPLAVLVLAIGLTGWFATSRMVRAEVLTVRERDYIAAARAQGAGPARILLRHVLPNVAAPIFVSAALGIGNVMLLEAGLSFLGLGVEPPTPSWGNMIADGAAYLRTAPWSTVFPGLAIALVVMSLNAVADGLRDALNPRREGTA